MTFPLPDPHLNTETYFDEPFFEFTDKAVVPPPNVGPNPPIVPDAPPPRPEPGNTDTTG